MPDLNALQQEFPAQDFSVVALSFDRKRAVVKKFITQKKIIYPVLMATPGISQDFGGVMALPTAFLINREGNVVKRYLGPVSREQLERDIRQVLK